VNLPVNLPVNLQDIVQRTPTPAPWSEGEKVPWNDPDFSQRMLRVKFHPSTSGSLDERQTSLCGIIAHQNR